MNGVGRPSDSDFETLFGGPIQPEPEIKPGIRPRVRQHPVLKAHVFQQPGHRVRLGKGKTVRGRGGDTGGQAGVQAPGRREGPVVSGADRAREHQHFRQTGRVDMLRAGGPHVQHRTERESAAGVNRVVIITEYPGIQ